MAKIDNEKTKSDDEKALISVQLAELSMKVNALNTYVGEKSAEIRNILANIKIGDSLKTDKREAGNDF